MTFCLHISSQEKGNWHYLVLRQIVDTTNNFAYFRKPVYVFWCSICAILSARKFNSIVKSSHDFSNFSSPLLKPSPEDWFSRNFIVHYLKSFSTDENYDRKSFSKSCFAFSNSLSFFGIVFCPHLSTSPVRPFLIVILIHQN